MNKHPYAIVAAIILAAFLVGPAAAQDDGDVQEIKRERPKKMREAEVPEEGASFADALAEVSAEEEKRDFVPKNEVTVIKSVKEDTAAKKEEKKAGKRPPVKPGNSVGGRIGLGNIFSIGGDLKVGWGDVNRLDVGVSGGAGFGVDGYFAKAFEMTSYYGWCFNMSDDGALFLFAGPGAAVGHYGASGKKTVIDTTVTPNVTGKVDDPQGGFNVGLGGQIGLEVKLSFIDPDHSLYNTFKNSVISVDFRPMFYFSRKAIENYPGPVLTLGLSFRQAF